MRRVIGRYVSGVGVVWGEPPTDAPSVAAHVVDDTMAPLEHPITGEVFNSKSAFRAVTKAHGCVEVGNDWRNMPPEKRFRGRGGDSSLSERMNKTLWDILNR